MSKAPWPNMDIISEPEDMKHLIQPRGPATGWVFRMITPLELVGKPNPWTGKPFGKEIKKGLGTRRLVEARKLRDVALGEVRQVALELSDVGRFSLKSAKDWNEAIREDDAKNTDPAAQGGVSMILNESLHKAERRGVSTARLKKFARVAFGEGFPIDHAISQFVEERGPDNRRGFKPLARTTVQYSERRASHAFVLAYESLVSLSSIGPLVMLMEGAIAPTKGCTPATAQARLNEMLWGVLMVVSGDTPPPREVPTAPASTTRRKLKTNKKRDVKLTRKRDDSPFGMVELKASRRPQRVTGAL